jgi:hypothetical protein
MLAHDHSPVALLEKISENNIPHLAENYFVPPKVAF